MKHLNLKLSSRNLQSSFPTGQVSENCNASFQFGKNSDLHVLLILSLFVYHTETLVPPSLNPTLCGQSLQDGTVSSGKGGAQRGGPWALPPSQPSPCRPPRPSFPASHTLLCPCGRLRPLVKFPSEPRWPGCLCGADSRFPGLPATPSAAGLELPGPLLQGVTIPARKPN